MSRPDVHIDLHLVLLREDRVLMGERRNAIFANGQYHVPAGMKALYAPGAAATSSPAPIKMPPPTPVMSRDARPRNRACSSPAKNAQR